MTKRKFLLAGVALAAAAVTIGTAAEPAPGPRYTADSRLQYPEDYRQWVYLSTGLGMTYGPLRTAGEQGTPKFDNVFVNPDAYRAFINTGHWPDKTIFVLEVRSGQSHGSINAAGHYQTNLLGVEAEVKDSSIPGGLWSFYSFDSDPKKPTKAIPRTADCYSCHTANTAVENTFVQFYPTLLPVAESKGTINASYKP